MVVERGWLAGAGECARVRAVPAEGSFWRGNLATWGDCAADMEAGREIQAQMRLLVEG